MNKVGKFRHGRDAFCNTCKSRFFIAKPARFAPSSNPQFLEQQRFVLLRLSQFDVDIAFEEAKSAQLNRCCHAHGLIAVAVPQGAR